jgi:flagellar basal-body rod modification protein FlgD
MTVSPVSATATTLPTKGTVIEQGANPKSGNQVLEADAFMKLLTTQMTSQDPMNPMKDTEFISQMANFTSLEQMRTLAKSFDAFTSSQSLATAASYIDKNVTVLDAATGSITGRVESVMLRESRPFIQIGGKEYDAKLISAIGTQPAPTETTPSTSTSTTSSETPTTSTSTPL